MVAKKSKQNLIIGRNNNTYYLIIVCFILGLISLYFLAYFEKVKLKNSPVKVAETEIEREPNSLDSINKATYSDINFSTTTIHIESVNQPITGWETWDFEGFPASLSYPSNRKASGDLTSVGFCQPTSCQDFYPVIRKQAKGIREIIDQYADCVELRTCYGRNITIAPFSLGSYKGIAVYYDKLQGQEAREQKLTGKIKYPEPDGPGYYYLLVNGSVYEILFDADDPTQRKMISTLKFR